MHGGTIIILCYSAWNKTRVKYVPVKRRQNLAKTDKGSYYREEWLEEFLDSKGAFYNGNESDNDENNEQQHYRRVLPKVATKNSSTKTN